MIHEETLRDLFEVFCDRAVKIFERDGYAAGFIFVLGADGNMHFLPVKSKEWVDAVVPALLHEVNAVALFHVGEAYRMTLERGDPFPKNGVKNDPRHIEVVQVMMESKCLNLLRSWEIKAEDVAKRYLVPIEEKTEGGELKSRWTGDWFKRGDGKA